MAGSKDTSQISPRLMDRGSVFNDVSPLPRVAFRVGLRIVLYRFLGRRFQNPPPLLKRELEQLDWIGRSCAAGDRPLGPNQHFDCVSLSQLWRSEFDSPSRKHGSIDLDDTHRIYSTIPGLAIPSLLRDFDFG